MPVKWSPVAAIILCQFLLAEGPAAEQWTEYHAESWSYYSAKLHKKLNFTNRFLYDADSIRRDRNGDLRVWVKEIYENDRFYVGKGNPEKETSFRQLQLWCEKRKFIAVMGEKDFELDESLGDEIRPGTQYVKLFDCLCRK